MPASGTPIAAQGNGAYLGVATNTVKMPTMTKKGAIGRLSIPSIGLNQYVYEGTSQASMRQGIAHFDSTSGWLGNIGLAGHNRGSYAAFGELKNVSLGDGVSYTTAYGTMNYVVTDIRTVASDDTSGLRQDGTNKITMYTCVANQPSIRLKVTASLVSVG
jgi:sortase A